MTESMHIVLVIEDDPAIKKVLRMLFEANGFRVVLADTAARGEQNARLHRPDVAVIDLGLPDGDGLDVIKSIRTWSHVPMVVLSARTAEAQRLAAFDAGVDDYVIKPFSGQELLARVRAILRRHVRPDLPSRRVQFGRVTVDMHRRIAQGHEGGEVRLTPLEHRILETLVRYSERIVTRTLLMTEVWGPDRGDSCALRVYIRSLRKKIELDPTRPQYILTELGVGYRLVMHADSPHASLPH